MLRALVSALMLSVTSALPLRAPARILSSCNNKPWRGCPEEGARLGEKLAGFSEAMAMYDGSKSDESGSACAGAGENGLDRAASKGLATSAAARNTWLQLYKSSGAVYADAFGSETIKGAATAELVANKYQAGGGHALHAIEQIAAPDATKGGVDGEAAAQSYLGRASWCLFQVLASVVPRRSSSAMGAAWRSSVVGYLLIWGDATRVAAETSVRGRSGRSDDNTKSKTMTRTNNPPRAPAGGLAQRRALTGYHMDDSSIRTAVAAWFADQSAAEAMYGHISTWDTSGVTDMSRLFCVREEWMDNDAEY